MHGANLAHLGWRLRLCVHSACTRGELNLMLRARLRAAAIAVTNWAQWIEAICPDVRDGPASCRAPSDELIAHHPENAREPNGYTVMARPWKPPCTSALV